MTAISIGCLLFLAGVLMILIKVKSILNPASNGWLIAIFIIITIAVAFLLYFTYEKKEEAREMAAQKALDDAQIERVEREAKEAGLDVQEYKEHLALPKEELLKRIGVYVANDGSIDSLDAHCQKLWQEHQTEKAAERIAAEKKFEESLKGEWSLVFSKPEGYNGKTPQEFFSLKVRVEEAGESFRMSVVGKNTVFFGEKTGNGTYRGSWSQDNGEGKFDSLVFSKNSGTGIIIVSNGKKLPMKLYR